jgi:hypothetical protein
MYKLMISTGLGILGTAVWTATLDAGDHGHRSMARSPAYNSPVVYPRYVQFHTANIGGMIFPVQVQINPSLFPGQPEAGPAAPDLAAGDTSMSGAGSMVGDHQGFGDHHGGPAFLPHPHVAVHGEHAAALMGHATAPRAGDSDQAAAASAQPNPAANPFSPRPPGAVGPGRRSAGTAGPGLPGPGQRITARW